MPKPLSPASITRAALLAAGLGLAATAAQAQRSLTIVVGTCPPATLAALDTDLKLTNGAVVKQGRNPPFSQYFCDLPVDDFATSTRRAWNTLELQYSDRNTDGIGHVRARLMMKRLDNGEASELAVVESVPSAGVQTVSVPLPDRLDPTRFAYFFSIELESPLEPVEAHMVRLTRR